MIHLKNPLSFTIIIQATTSQPMMFFLFIQSQSEYVVQRELWSVPLLPTIGTLIYLFQTLKNVDINQPSTNFS